MVQMIDPRGGWQIWQRAPLGDPKHDMQIEISVSLSTKNSDGTGTFSGIAKANGQQGQLENGTINGDAITFIVEWPNRVRGDYRGYRFIDGYLRGHTINLSNMAQTAEWWSAAHNFPQVEV